MNYDNFLDYLKDSANPWEMQEKFLSKDNKFEHRLEEICSDINTWILRNEQDTKRFVIEPEHLLDNTGVAIAMSNSYGYTKGTELDISPYKNRLIYVRPKTLYGDWRICVFLRAKLNYAANSDPIDYLPLVSVT